MNTCRASRLIKCPECGETYLSFLETRKLTVYFRQAPEAPPDGKAARVLVEERGGSLYEEETQTGYGEDIQAYCHSCGYKWKTPECTRMEDLLNRDDSKAPEAEPQVPEEAAHAEALSPEGPVQDDALLPEKSMESVSLPPGEAVDADTFFPEVPPQEESAQPEEITEEQSPVSQEVTEPEPSLHPRPEPVPEPPPPPRPEPVPQPSKPPRQRKARKIKATELVNDVVAGMADPQLMSKYNIHASQLEALLQRLVDKGLVTQQQIDARVNLADTAITKAFVETQRSMQELDYAETQSVDPVEALAAVKKEVTPPPQPAKPKIKAKQFVRDVEARMSDPQLMEKYGLDEKQLNSLFQRLVDLGMLSVQILYNRTSISDTSITKAFVEVYQSLEELEE